ncbi:Vps4 C terminal oligomerisation domain [Nesidiocoris tenuis]|uniref:Fidgetin-like protein 1 n=1 Tax=Nesidiocoris tenuis TaxID=355587 RepID=A0ABN7AXA2_9HEMI|nr:Vps4 C terminal oligomerisation domain [Nesidiocoris tenuis]
MSEDPYLELSSRLKFETKSHPAPQALNARRANILLAHAYLGSRNPDWLASDVLETKLFEYANLVDDRSGINNFAASTLELTSKLRKDCKSWKCSLSLDGPNLKKLLGTVEGECSNTSENGCTAYLPDDVSLKEFGDFSSTENCTAHVPEHQNSIRSNGTTPSEPFQQPSNMLIRPHLPSSSASKDQNVTSDHKMSNFKVKRPALSHTLSNESESGNPSRSDHLGNGWNPYNSSVEAINNATVGSSVYFRKVPKRAKKWRQNDDEDESAEDPPPKISLVTNGSSKFGPTTNFGGANDTRSEDGRESSAYPGFRTAYQQLKIDNRKKFGNSGDSIGRGHMSEGGSNGYHPAKFIKKTLGGKGVVNSRFVSPLLSNSTNNDEKNARKPSGPELQEDEEVDERLKNIEPRMIELIKNEIMDCGSRITWDDIAGLHFAKTTIQEIVVWPMLRPDIFTGLRRPPKGILLFGPPGTGKTLIGKCIASQSGSTFFSISASSLTSKWIGEGEKMVRALFAVARVEQPAVVFIDEIDSLLSQRSETEHESSRRIKTEFLVQLDGAGTDEEDRILVIGATNRPQELDEAARRRLVKRLYIPLPDLEARKELICQLMKCERNELTPQEIEDLGHSTDGFSGADMKHLCQEACLGPIRSLAPSMISSIAANQVRPVSMADFTSALKRVHPSVGPEDLHQYVNWNNTYGSGSKAFRFMGDLRK